MKPGDIPAESELVRCRGFVERTVALMTPVDGAGVFLFVNHAAQKVFGIAPDAGAGCSVFDSRRGGLETDSRQTPQCQSLALIECSDFAHPWVREESPKNATSLKWHWSTLAIHASVARCGTAR